MNPSSPDPIAPSLFSLAFLNPGLRLALAQIELLLRHLVLPSLSPELLAAIHERWDSDPDHPAFAGLKRRDVGRYKKAKMRELLTELVSKGAGRAPRLAVGEEVNCLQLGVMLRADRRSLAAAQGVALADTDHPATGLLALA